MGLCEAGVSAWGELSSLEDYLLFLCSFLYVLCDHQNPDDFCMNVVLLSWVDLSWWSAQGELKKPACVPYLLPQWSNWSILLKPAGKGSVSHDSDPGNHLAQKEFPFYFHVICKGRAWPDGKTSTWMGWLVWGILKTLSAHWVKKKKQNTIFQIIHPQIKQLKTILSYFVVVVVCFLFVIFKVILEMLSQLNQ